MRHLIALTLLAPLLSACWDEPNVGYIEYWTDKATLNSMLQKQSTARALPVIISGEVPHLSRDEVAELLSNKNWGDKVRLAVMSPEDAPKWRLVIQVDRGFKNPGFDACADQPLTLPPADGKIAFHAAFCSGEKWYSRAIGFLPKGTESRAETETLLTDLFRRIFPKP